MPERQVGQNRDQSGERAVYRPIEQRCGEVEDAAQQQRGVRENCDSRQVYKQSQTAQGESDGQVRPAASLEWHTQTVVGNTLVLYRGRVGGGERVQRLPGISVRW